MNWEKKLWKEKDYLLERKQLRWKRNNLWYYFKIDTKKDFFILLK